MKTEFDLLKGDYYSEARVVQRLRKARYMIGRPLHDGVPRCYLAGPMTGLPEFNVHAFAKASDILRESGWVVFNPCENDADKGIVLEGTDGSENFNFRGAMHDDLSWILKWADVVFLMPGWEHSTGAGIEAYVALQCKIPCFSYPGVREITMFDWDDAYYQEEAC